MPLFAGADDRSRFTPEGESGLPWAMMVAPAGMAVMPLPSVMLSSVLLVRRMNVPLLPPSN